MMKYFFNGLVVLVGFHVLLLGLPSLIYFIASGIIPKNTAAMYSFGSFFITIIVSIFVVVTYIEKKNINER